MFYVQSVTSASCDELTGSHLNTVRRNTASDASYASAVYIGIYGGGGRGNEALAALAVSASFPRHPPPYKIIQNMGETRSYSSIYSIIWHRPMVCNDL